MATPGSLEDHSICRPRSTLPLPSVSVAWSLVVSLTARLTLAGVTATAPTGTGVAVTVNLAVSAGEPLAVWTTSRYVPSPEGAEYVMYRVPPTRPLLLIDRKSTRLNSSHPSISYAVFCLKKKKQNTILFQPAKKKKKKKY